MQDIQIIRSRCLLPISSPPILDGGMVTESGVIKDIGPWKRIKQSHSGSVMDLGEAVVMPGLINAHCHLEYTQMAEKLDPGSSFTGWIQSMIELKNSWSLDDFQRSWQTGYEQTTACGTTTVADTLSQPIRLGTETLRKGTRLLPLFEWIQLEGLPWDEAKVLEMEHLTKQADQKTGFMSGLSPHALYTTSPALWDDIQHHPDFSKRPISVHLAESQEESDLFQKQSGAMHDWFASMHHLPQWGTGSPVEILNRKQLLRKGMILIHVNALQAGDVETLAKHQVGIVHCPRSHQYFDHPPFQLERCLSQGIPVALGTDSLASMRSDQHPRSLSLFHEMRLLLDLFPSVTPDQAFHMATLQAAKVLGLEQTVGSLAPGKQADWISVPWSGQESGVLEDILSTTTAPHRVVIRGVPTIEKQI